VLDKVACESILMGATSSLIWRGLGKVLHLCCHLHELVGQGYHCLLELDHGVVQGVCFVVWSCVRFFNFCLSGSNLHCINWARSWHTEFMILFNVHKDCVLLSGQGVVHSDIHTSEWAICGEKNIFYVRFNQLTT